MVRFLFIAITLMLLMLSGASPLLAQTDDGIPPPPRPPFDNEDDPPSDDGSDGDPANDDDDDDGRQHSPILAEIVGSVFDRTTGLPGAGVTVLVNDMPVRTDARGYFSIVNLPLGTYTVRLDLPPGLTPQWPPQELIIAERKRYWLGLNYFSQLPPAGPEVTYTGPVTPASSAEPAETDPGIPPDTLPTAGAAEAGVSPQGPRFAFRPLVRAVPSLCGLVYLVGAGDSLSGLGQQFYGTPLAYSLIIEATALARQDDPTFAPLPHPARLEPGSKLCLPDVRPRL